MDDEKELPDIPWLERILDETPPPDTDYIAMLEELEYKQLDNANLWVKYEAVA